MQTLLLENPLIQNATWFTSELMNPFPDPEIVGSVSEFTKYRGAGRNCPLFFEVFRTLNTEIFRKHAKQYLKEAFISKNWPSPIYCRGQSIQPSWFDQAATIFPVHSSTTPRYSTVFTSTQNLRLFLFHQ